MTTVSPTVPRKHSFKTPVNEEHLKVGEDMFFTAPMIVSRTVTKQRTAYHQEDKENAQPIFGFDDLAFSTPLGQSDFTISSQSTPQSPNYIVGRQPEVKCSSADLVRQNEVLKQENKTLKQQVLDLTRMVVSFEKASHTVILNNAIVPKPECFSEVVSDLKAKHEQVTEDLRGVEQSFSVLYRCYERLKNICDENKKTEELKAQLANITDKLVKSEDRFRRLKENAQLQMDKADNEIERLQNLIEAETLGLRAHVKKQSLTIDTLQKQLEQKEKEFTELSGICDELMAKLSK